MNKKILCKLGIHNWKYLGDSNLRYCKRCNKKQKLVGWGSDFHWTTFNLPTFLRSYKEYLKDKDFNKNLLKQAVKEIKENYPELKDLLED